MTTEGTSVNLTTFPSVCLSFYAFPHVDDIEKVALHCTGTHMYTHRSAESEEKVCSLSIFRSFTYSSLVTESSLKNTLLFYSPNVQSHCECLSILTCTYLTYPIASDLSVPS